MFHTFFGTVVDLVTMIVLLIMYLWKKTPFARNIIPFASRKIKEHMSPIKKINMKVILLVMDLEYQDRRLKLSNIYFAFCTFWSIIRADKRLKLKVGSPILQKIELYSREKSIINLTQLFSKNRPLVLFCGSCT